MTILVFTPTWLDTPAGVEAMHPKVRAAIAVNMSADMEWVVGRDNPYPVPDHRNVLSQYRQARELFLAGGYDALITVEHDNLLPDAGALQRLQETPGDVVYAPYLLRHGSRVLSTCQYINDHNLGMSLSNYPDELRQARAHTVHRVSGVGMGCTLFRRAVLEKIGFEPTTAQNLLPDMQFATQALRAGFKSFGRFDVPVLHYSDGHWLVPFEGDRMQKYLARQTITALVGERSVKLIAGEVYDLPEAAAENLLRAGYIQPVEAPEQPAALPPVERAVDAAQEQAAPVEQAVAPAQKRRKKA